MIERIRIESREQWLSLRLKDVTASVVGGLIGVHPIVTPARLAYEKRGGKLPESTTKLQERGLDLELVTAKQCSRLPHALERGWSYVKAEEYYRDPERRIGATPDFHIEGDARGPGVLQTKVVAAGKFRRDWANGPPFWIALQCATEIMLTESTFGAIGALVIGEYTWDSHLFEVPRHAGAERRIRQLVAAFWDNLDNGREPQIDYERDSALLSVLYPHAIPDKVLDLTSDNRLPELLSSRDEIAKQQSTLERQRRAIEAEIIDKVKDAEMARARGWLVTLREVHRAEYVVKETTYRQLRVKREMESSNDQHSE